MAAEAPPIKNGVLPDFVVERMKLWDEIKIHAEKVRAEAPHNPIKVTLPDGKEMEAISNETTPFDLAMKISKGLANAAIAAKIDGVVYDLNRPLVKDCKLELLKWDAPEAQKIFWHSSAHILGQALERKFAAHLCTGPPLEEGGFYYDVSVGEDQKVSQSDYQALQQFVEEAVAQKQPFERLELTKDQALEMFRYNKYKVEILKDKVPDGAICTAYRCGPLIDLCRGPHVPNTSKVKAFAVTNNSASYWKGDAKNDDLQRVYGMSFPEKKQLDEFLEFRRLAAERDHRLIGKNQELFMFHQYSPGSCFMLPHGAKIYNKLQNFIRAEYRKRGFSEVISPNIFNVELWKTSGHWQIYKPHMFGFKVEEEDWALKPMNCPGHCLMFASRARSYKELPIRFADFGVLHRNEDSGALTGLTRVRRFQQDDAHIFCRQDQIEEEMAGALDFLRHVYGVFGFEFQLFLSTMPDEHLGEEATWHKAEAQLQKALESVFPGNWKINAKDGAFYGPKIDIKVFDALKRSHQCATIQLDFQLPQRFQLGYNKADDSLERPVIIHRAIFGSLERFIAILIEHTGGKWPFWLSPRQCVVMSVSEKYDAYAKSVHKEIFDAGFDCDFDDSAHLLKKKIRDAQVAQYNFIIVVGAQEEEKKTVNVRTRDNVVHGERTVQELIAEFNQLVKEFNDNRSLTEMKFSALPKRSGKSSKLHWSMRRPNVPTPEQRFYLMDPSDQRSCSFYKSRKFALWILGPTFVLALFGWAFYAFSYLLCIQYLADEPALSALFLVIFNGLMIMAAISLLRTTFSDPGSVPSNFEDDVLLRERDTKGEMRFCKVCNRLKPDRAHHCSTLGQCVLKMDHFCPWVGNTVGFRNYKFFMLFLTYVSLLCIAAFGMTLKFTIHYLSSSKFAAAQINQIALTFVCAIFGLVLSIFTGQHYFLVLQNLTTLETFDRARFTNNFYNIGFKKNWAQVFGNVPHLWFIPYRNPVGDGVQWEINVEEVPLSRSDDVV